MADRWLFDLWCLDGVLENLASPAELAMVTVARDEGLAEIEQEPPGLWTWLFGPTRRIRTRQRLIDHAETV